MTLSLWWSVLSLEARVALSYRVDFWLNALVAPATQFLISYCLWAAVFAESGKTLVGGLQFNELVAYYIAAILLGRMVRGKEFADMMSAEIYDGSLNRYLLFPVAYFPFKYAQHLGKTAPQAVQTIAVLLIVLLTVQPEGVITALRDDPIGVALVLLMTGATIALANLLHWLMLAPLQFVAFWADNVWSLVVAHRFLSNLFGGLMVPLILFPDWSLPLLRWLPFQFFFDVPARALLGQIGWTEWAGGMAICAGWCAVFAAISAIVWRRGNLKYTGVGI